MINMCEYVPVTNIYQVRIYMYVPMLNHLPKPDVKLLTPVQYIHLLEYLSIYLKVIHSFIRSFIHSCIHSNSILILILLPRFLYFPSLSYPILPYPQLSAPQISLASAHQSICRQSETSKQAIHFPLVFPHNDNLVTRNSTSNSTPSYVGS